MSRKSASRLQSSYQQSGPGRRSARGGQPLAYARGSVNDEATQGKGFWPIELGTCSASW
jgi:hypothetical protein